jgi:hypothetical protein
MSWSGRFLPVRPTAANGSFAHLPLQTDWWEAAHTTHSDERLIAKAF